MPCCACNSGHTIPPNNWETSAGLARVVSTIENTPPKKTTCGGIEESRSQTPWLLDGILINKLYNCHKLVSKRN